MATIIQVGASARFHLVVGVHVIKCGNDSPSGHACRVSLAGITCKNSGASIVGGKKHIDRIVVVGERVARVGIIHAVLVVSTICPFAVIPRYGALAER